MRRQSGLTLLELLITLSIVAILLTLAVPSFITFTSNNQIISSTNNFVADINLARSEAVRRGTMVSICRLNTNNACTTADTCNCGNTTSTQYESGYILYVNPNRDPVKDAGEEVIRVYQPSDSDVTVRGSTNGDRRFSFVPDGTLDPGDIASGALGTAHVICLNNANDEDTPCRVVNVRATGQTSSTRLNGSAAVTPNTHRQ